MTEQWVWRRWQLVSLDEADGEVTLDAIELSNAVTDAEGDAGPVTVVFRDGPVPDGAGDTVAEMLQRWLDREDGLCDVFHRRDAPLSMFAMFQGTDAVLASVHDLG
ncbi:MAG: hypothetical protein ACJ739_06170 [Acidimicrobiales bacterium]